MLRLPLNSHHPACVAYRTGRLEEYNVTTFGAKYTKYFYVRHRGHLVRRAMPNAHQTWYAPRFRYVGSTTPGTPPARVNCVEFCQRALCALGIDAPRFVALPLWRRRVLYLPFVLGAPRRAPRDVVLRGCDAPFDAAHVRRVLQGSGVEVHVVAVLVPIKRTALRGRHVCLVLRHGDKCFSVSVGETLAPTQHSAWTDVFVSIPDPLLVRHRADAFVLGSTTVAHARALQGLLKV